MTPRAKTTTKAGSAGPAPLTGRQKAILDYIVKTHRTRGYPPTVREIGEAVGLQSPSSVHAQLATLAERGFLKKDADRPRAIVVKTDMANEAPAAGRGNAALQTVPILGQIAAGAPILAEQNVDSTITLSQELVGKGTLFALRVRGDSMIGAGILDGDTVIVRQQQQAEDGEIVAALVDGEEATVKTLRRLRGRVELEAANPAYGPIVADDVRILGKVVSVLRTV